MLVYSLPFISAFIGWFTNWIAIKMLFHPKEEKRFLGLKIQGIFPKRQKQFAEKLGNLVAKELISFEDIEHKINNPATIQKALPFIETHIDNYIKNKLSKDLPIVSMFIGSETITKIKTGIVTEVESMLPTMISNLTSNIKNDLDIEKIVVEKVSNFSSEKLEEILNAIMKKEFVFVEIIGGVLGFIIGLVQVLITHL